MKIDTKYLLLKTEDSDISQLYFFNENTKILSLVEQLKGINIKNISLYEIPNPEGGEHLYNLSCLDYEGNIYFFGPENSDYIKYEPTIPILDIASNYLHEHYKISKMLGVNNKFCIYGVNVDNKFCIFFINDYGKVEQHFMFPSYDFEGINVVLNNISLNYDGIYYLYDVVINDITQISPKNVYTTKCTTLSNYYIFLSSNGDLYWKYGEIIMDDVYNISHPGYYSISYIINYDGTAEQLSLISEDEYNTDENIIVDESNILEIQNENIIDIYIGISGIYAITESKNIYYIPDDIDDDFYLLQYNNKNVFISQDKRYIKPAN